MLLPELLRYQIREEAGHIHERNASIDGCERLRRYTIRRYLHFYIFIFQILIIIVFGG